MMLDDALWTIVGVMLAIALLVIFPIYQEYQHQEALIQLKLIQDVDGIVQKITTSGELDRLSYEQLCSQLATSGYSFDLQIERQKRKVYPIYQDPLDANTFEGKLAVIYEFIDNDEILETLYAEGNKSYKFGLGDYIAISVKSKTQARSDLLAQLLWHVDINRPSFYTRIGGMVANETP